MIKHVIIEAVASQQIALVVDGIERPVITQFFGAEHQHPVITQFVILDDGKSLKRLAQPHTIRNDAAVVALKFVDGTEHSIALEFIELVPDQGVFEAGLAADDFFFVYVLQEILEDVVEGEEVNELRRLILEQVFQVRQQQLLGVLNGCRIAPD